MAVPVPVDDLKPFPLERMGHVGGFVLTPGDSTSATLRYRIPNGTESAGRFLRVVLRARVELDGDHGDQGFATVSLLTSNASSATAEITPSGPRGRRKVRWVAGVLHGGKSEVTSRENFRIAFSNYAREQGSNPGVHSLRFRLRVEGGMRVRRVVIEPSSGLYLTRQPLQALKLEGTAVSPPAPQAGQPFTVTAQLKNVGVMKSGPVTFSTLHADSVRRLTAEPRIANIPAGRSAGVSWRFTARGTGRYRIQSLASSRVGQALLDISPAVAEPAPAAASAVNDGTSSSGDGGGSMPAQVLGVLAGIAAIVAGALGIRARRARTFSRRTS